MSTPAFPSVPELLDLHRRDLEALIRAEAGGLLAWEEVEDLVQGARTRILERAGSFTYQNPESALAWLRVTARTHLAHRREHWRALRRKPAVLLRLVVSDEETRSAIPMPADTATGPGTFAERREALTLGIRALDLLIQRDRELVMLTVDGHSTQEIAQKLNLSVDSAGRAQRRAMDRLRRTFRLLAGRRG
ncbi:MAG: RNA polymerase sigma factor [Planctomycetota bacterium]